MNRVTLGNVSCNLARQRPLKGVVLLSEVKRCCDTKQQIEKFVAALRDALPQVELISTSRDCGGNKNVTQNVCSRVCYTGQVSCNLCRYKIARQLA